MSIKKYTWLLLSIKSLQDFLLKTYVVNEASYVSRELKTKTWNILVSSESWV